MKFLSKIGSFLLCAVMLAQGAQGAIVPSIPYNLTNGSLADATQVMGNFNTILAGVNANAAHSGVNSDITSLTALTTPITPAQGGTSVYTGGTTGGSANVQTLLVVSPASFSLIAGNGVTGIAGFSNTGAMTLNVGATGATAVRKLSSSGPIALTGGETIAGNSYLWYFDGTYFILINPVLGNIAVLNTDGTNFTASGGNLAFGSAPVLPNPTVATTQTAADSSTKVATTAFVNQGGLTLGTSTATTQTTGDSSTKLATTAFVQASIIEVPLGVGSIILARHDGGNVTAGGTVAAATLTPVYLQLGTSGGANPSGDTITGTWQALTSLVGSNTNATLFQRIL